MNEQHHPQPPAPAESGYLPPAPPAGPAPQSGPVGYPQHMAVAPKNPGIALLASFFIPGLGTLINGEVGKGIGIMVGYAVSVVMAVFLVGIPFMIGFWIWGMVDAYGGARKWNARHGIIS